MLKHGVVIRSARHLNTKSKEPVEVELKDKDGGTYTLTFASPKYAKQFIDSDRLPIYVPDQNRGIADKLLKLLEFEFATTPALESFNEKTLSSLKRQESRDSIESADSSTKSYKKSNSNLSLSVDEVMKRAIEYIEMNLNAEGLYSRSGTPDKTNKILKKLSKKKSTELDKYRNEVHDICNALMIYIKELPEPLVDYNTVETLAKIY
ncbi:hypothetical protein GWI33_012433, partial [Rhynchophorus ferrugineus]